MLAGRLTRGGFRMTTGTETLAFFNAYVAENRQYIGLRRGLRTGPYNFGLPGHGPDLVEHFPYQDGSLISTGTPRTPTTTSAITRAKA